MKRREFMTAGGLAALTAASGVTANPALAQRPAPRHDAPADAAAAGDTLNATGQLGLRPGRDVTLRVSLPRGSTITGPADLALRALREIAALSDGAIGFTSTDAAGRLLPDDDADLTFGSEHQMVGRHPGFAYFAGLPGPDALSGAVFQTWLRSAGGQQAWSGLALDWGYQPLAIAHLGADQPLFLADHVEADGIQDIVNTLSGRRIAANGLTAHVAAGLGAKLVSNDPPFLGSTSPTFLGERAFMTGEADAFEGVGFYQALQLGLPDRAQSALTPALASAGTIMCLRIAGPAWHALSPQQQDLIAAASAAVYDRTLAEAANFDAAARTVCRNRFSVAIASAPAAWIDRVARIARATIAHAAGHDMAARRIDEGYWAFAKRVLPDRTASMTS